MTSTSVGSRPDPLRFLTEYSQNVEDVIKDLQAQRVPAEGDYAMRGIEGLSIKDKVANRSIQV